MKIDRKLFFCLSLGFVFATIAGTVTHEAGHYIVAKWLGYTAHIHYAYTQWEMAGPGQATGPSDGFFIALGGPVLTLLIAITGLALIWIFRKKIGGAERLSFTHWMYVFLSLFWLRPTVNFFVWLGSGLIQKQFSDSSDEIRLAQYLALPDWIISLFSALSGLLVLTLIFCKIIPAKQRITFLTSALVGGAAGYMLWLHGIGPYVMP